MTVRFVEDGKRLYEVFETEQENFGLARKDRPLLRWAVEMVDSLTGYVVDDFHAVLKKCRPVR